MKAVTVYKFNKEVPTIDTLDLEEFGYTPCSDLQLSTIGFVPNVDGHFVSDVSGFTTLRVTKQEKKVNKHEVETKTDQQVLVMERTENRTLSKKEKAAIEQDVILTLLPNTFPNKPTVHNVFIKDGLLFVEGSRKVAEEVTALIRKAVGSLPIIPLDVKNDVCNVMTEMVTYEEFDKITLREKIKLETQEERKVNITNGAIEGGECVDLIKDGAVVIAMQMNYDGVLDFMLAEDMNISTMKFDKSLTEELDKNDAAGTFIIQMTETDKMVRELVKLFGGYSEE